MRKQRLRILWHGVAPFVCSGYGIVTKNVALRIGQVYPTVISCYYGLHTGGSLRIHGVRVLPTVEKDYGEYSVKHFIKKFKINLPIIASDFWPFPWFALLPNSMFYGPIDSYSYIDEDIRCMKAYSYFVPCSKFGGKVYRKLTKRKPTAVIPHGVDLNIFKPYPKEECRKIFNLNKKKFVIGIVAANSDPEPRKGWDDLFVTLEKFFEKFPKERKRILIFAYTRPGSPKGLNLYELAKRCHLERNVIFPEHLAQVVGLPDFEMAKLYSTFDLFLNASRREGFCLPVLEAQACGVPVIAANSSALPELVKGHGWLVKTKERVFTPRGWECEKVDRDDLLKKLEEAYFDKELRQKYSELSRKFSLSYSWNKIFKEQWLPLLEEIERNNLNKIIAN